jgi:hypothetical protein
VLYHDFEHSVYGANSFTAAEARENIDNYLSGLVKTPVRTLEEMTEWNKNHPEDQAGIGENIDFVEKSQVALMTLYTKLISLSRRMTRPSSMNLMKLESL